MPRGDRSGPQGMGPMTGRGAGYCAGYGAPGYMNPAGGAGPGYGRGLGFGRGVGRGFGRGRGVGRGVGRGFGRGRGVGRGWAGAVPQAFGYAPLGAVPPAPTREQELDMLESQAKGFEETLSDIRKRISELTSEKE